VVIHIGLPILAIAFCHFMGPNLNPELPSRKKKDEEIAAYIQRELQNQKKEVKSNLSDVDKKKKSSGVVGKVPSSKIEDKKETDGSGRPKELTKSLFTLLSKDTAPPILVKTIASDESAVKYGSAKSASFFSDYVKVSHFPPIHLLIFPLFPTLLATSNHQDLTARAKVSASGDDHFPLCGHYDEAASGGLTSKVAPQTWLT
jgi:hypothetical protein